MNLFIAQAWAEEAGGPAGAVPPQGSPVVLWLLMLVLFGFFYFVAIRPQQKRAKEHRAMVEALAKGDEAVTSGGLLGRVTHVGEQFVTLEVAEGLSVKVQKHAIGAVMPKGTIKST